MTRIRKVSCVKAIQEMASVPRFRTDTTSYESWPIRVSMYTNTAKAFEGESYHWKLLVIELCIPTSMGGTGVN